MQTDEQIVASVLAEHGYGGPDGSFEKSLAHDVALDALRVLRAQLTPKED